MVIWGKSGKKKSSSGFGFSLTLFVLFIVDSSHAVLYVVNHWSNMQSMPLKQEK